MLDHKHLSVTTVKYLSDYRKHRCKLVDEQEKNKNKKLLASKVIIGCRTTFCRAISCGTYS